MLPWRVASETGRPTDVLVCPPNHYRWISGNAIIRRTLAAGAQPDAAALRAQHAELAYARDSAVVTPWGAPCRAGWNGRSVAASTPPCWTGTPRQASACGAGAPALGCDVLALRGGRVVSARASRDPNAALRAGGLTMLDPELSPFTAGGGGPHCLTCPLARDEEAP